MRQGWVAAGGPETLLSYLYPNIYARMLSPARDSRGYNQAAREQRLPARKSLQEYTASSRRLRATLLKILLRAAG